MKRKILALVAIPVFIFTLTACEFPDTSGEQPTLSVETGDDCVVDTTDPYNPKAGYEVTVELTNNMPTSDPDIGAFIPSDTTDAQGNDVGVVWTDYTDEDGPLFYTDSSNYNVVEPGQTATITYLDNPPSTTSPPYWGGTYAMWFFTDEDSDEIIEADVFDDDVFTASWITVETPSTICTVCPPGQTWNPQTEFCET